MDKSKIENEVLLIFKEVFKSTPAITEQTSVEDVKEWDSLNHMVLISLLEKKFNIVFDLFELIELRSVGGFIAYITRELEDGSEGA